MAEAIDTGSMEVKDLVEAIVKAIVDHPDQVVCREVVGTHSSVLELEVHPEDVGKVIGRKGIHAESIRHILNAAGGKRRMRYILEIVEERPPRR